MKTFGMIGVALSLASCSLGTPDFTTKHGEEIFVNSADPTLNSEEGKAEIQRVFGLIEDDYLNEVEVQFGSKIRAKAQECLLNEQVEIVDDKPDCRFNENKSPYLVGCYDGVRGRIILKNPRYWALQLPRYTPWEFALAHELHHMVQWCVWAEVDIHHENAFWKVVNDRQQELYWAYMYAYDAPK